MMAEPFTTRYLRWRNKRFGYKATITNLLSYRGQQGYYTMVHLLTDKGSKLFTPSTRLVTDFKPIRSSRINVTKSSFLRQDPFE